jgi:hypothetical protein
MKSLLIAVLAATGLATCACGSLGGAAAPPVTGPAPAASVTTAPHRHGHHHHCAAVTAATQGLRPARPAPRSRHRPRPHA